MTRSAFLPQIQHTPVSVQRWTMSACTVSTHVQDAPFSPKIDQNWRGVSFHGCEIAIFFM